MGDKGESTKQSGLWAERWEKAPEWLYIRDALKGPFSAMNATPRFFRHQKYPYLYCIEGRAIFMPEEASKSLLMGPCYVLSTSRSIGFIVTGKGNVLG